MKLRTHVSAALLALVACTALPARAEDKPAQAPPSAAEQQQAMMQAMEKAMTPGEPHKHLARMSGDWTFTNSMWMDPAAPPMQSTGTMHGEMMMGGRYLVADWKGSFMGQAFEGRGTSAYNNVAKMYEDTWIDNMGTGIMYSTGTCDESGNKCTYTGEGWDPMSGQKSTMRSVMTWTDDNNFKMEMYGSMTPGSPETKMMEIVVKRKM